MPTQPLRPKTRRDAVRRAAVPIVLVVALLGLAGCGNRIPRPAALTAATPTGSDESAAPVTVPEQGVASSLAGAETSAGTGTGTAAGQTSAGSNPASSAGGAGVAGGASAANSGASNTAASNTAGSNANSGRAPAARSAAASQANTTPGAPSPGGTPPPGAVTPAGGCTGNENALTIGTVGTQSGVLGEFLRDGPLAVRAWVSAMNEKGGLSCHQIKYVIGDDGADPNRHRSLVQQMVEKEGVIGFVYMNAPFSGYSAVEYLNQKRVPVVGSEGASSWFYSSPMYFPQASSGSLLVPVGLISMAQMVGRDKKVAQLMCVESAVCAEMEKELPAQAPQFGLKVVYQGRGSVTQPDYTSHCLSAKQAGADFMAMALDGNSAIRVARSCNSVGYKPTYVVWVTAVKTDFDKEPVMEGVIAALSNRPWFESGHPAVAEFQAALKKHAPGLNTGVPQSYGWSAAKLFEAAGGGKLPANATSADLLRGLWTIKGNDLGGLTSPLTFAEGQPVSRVVCAFPAQVRGGKWVAGQRECL